MSPTGTHFHNGKTENHLSILRATVATSMFEKVSALNCHDCPHLDGQRVTSTVRRDRHCLAYLADFAILTGGAKSETENRKYAETGPSRVPAQYRPNERLPS